MSVEPVHDAARSVARVVAHHRDRYVIRDQYGDRDAVLTGRFRHHISTAEDLPAVGDWVELIAQTQDVGQICGVLPRRSAFRRKTAGTITDVQIVAANVDLAIIATALPHDVNLRRLERYLALGWESGALPLIVLTKADLVDDVASAIAEVRAIAPGVDVLALSTLTGDGVADLARHLTDGMTAVLLGSSGVGKSTLVNALIGAERQRTAEVRDDGAGRHTTTHRELIDLPGGASLIDTPGMRELQLWSAADGLDTTFDDITRLAESCRFADCRHDTEPDCAVRLAVETGALDPARLESWNGLRRELAYLERKQDAAANALARNYAKSMEKLLRARLREKE